MFTSLSSSSVRLQVLLPTNKMVRWCGLAGGLIGSLNYVNYINYSSLL